MASYISSNANRFYTALESAYGEAGSGRGRQPHSGVEAGDPAAERTGRTEGQDRQPDVCRDAGRWTAAHHLRIADVPDELVEDRPAGLRPAVPGGARRRAAVIRGRHGGCTAPPTGSSDSRLPHGLAAGQAVSSGGEIRFVAALVSDSAVRLNAPFTVTPAAGAAIGSAITYVPATELPSVSLFDYWSPATAVQRMLAGPRWTRCPYK